MDVYLGTLDPEKVRAITRRGNLETVLDGINAARDAGLKIKINTVALKNFNEHELSSLVGWCGDLGLDLTFIETMPLGDIEGDRTEQYLSLSGVREKLMADWTLEDSEYHTGGPASYVRVIETGGRIGFITPLSHNFCSTCNRVRVTCPGTLYMCLGQDESVDLREPLPASHDDAA